jgi:hypothetical protein
LVIALLLLLGAVGLAQEGYRFQVERYDSGVMSFSLMGESEIEKSFVKDYHTHPLYYLFLLPGPLITIVSLFRRSIKSRKAERASRRSGIVAMFLLSTLFLVAPANSSPSQYAKKGLDAFESKSYSEAIQWFSKSEDVGGENSSLRYNRALSHFVLGQEGHAVFHLRESIRIDPRKSVPRRVLDELERELSLDSQVAPGRRIHPNSPFVLTLIFGNLFALSLAFLLRFKRGGLFILSTLLFIALIGSIGIFLFALAERAKPIAVVAIQGGSVKRIPVDNAREWMSLDIGTSLLVTGHAQGYYLVKTGLGLEGWIKIDSVLYRGR